jgi:serine/threonine-protein kinase
VSRGKARALVPEVVGKTLTDAVAQLTAAGLKASVVEVYSSRPPGRVTAQSLQPGTSVVAGTVVRINVSKGLRPQALPSLVGKTYEEAVILLQRAGFRPAPPKLVDSSQPRGTVLAMDPPGGSQQPRGATVTLTVSKGPRTAQVPDVTGLDRPTAAAELRSSGLKVTVSRVATSDPSQDGVVLSQVPSGGSEVPLGTAVTIVVGRFVAPPTSPPETTPQPPPATSPATPPATTPPSSPPPTTPSPSTPPSSPPTGTAPSDTVPLP